MIRLIKDYVDFFVIIIIFFFKTLKTQKSVIIKYNDYDYDDDERLSSLNIKQILINN